ncbi:SsgA family sporulation/cell division regulator (plasmid) [Streptomyces sp. NBC_01343]|uniref:SsgA family sporulation/cell division regulator n=1 Tax=Streptomyces sp. NBC_01343 TaxID=2903832 RepID=UPI002E148A08|nr:SsgA family sporulation/cell division regulator [Streptomyces sp. NBC_01343]
MSVDKDDTMYSTAEDAEFAALMAASSLGAPHVQTCATGIDEGTRRQLRAAVSATGEEALSLPGDEDLDAPAAAAARTSVKTDAVAADDGPVATRASTLPRHHTLLVCDIERISALYDHAASARRRVLALLVERASQDWGVTPWRSHLLHEDRGDGVLLVASPGSGKTETYLNLMREALRGSVRSERLHQRALLHPAGEAAVSLLRCANENKQSRPRTDYLLNFDRWAWSVDAKHQTSACHYERQQRWMLELCHWSQAPAKPPEPQSARRPVPLPGDDLVLTVSEQTWRSAVEGGTLRSERLTDLLHAPPPSPWARLTLRSAQLGELSEALVWKLGQSRDCQRSLPGWSAFAGYVDRGAVRPFDARPEPVADLTLSPESLLIASELAVDLDSARRQPIPAQAAPPPNMDEYAVRPGSTLLVPRGEQTTLESQHAPSRHGPGPGEGENLVEGTGALLWSKKDEERGERQARLWMRVHLHEGDTGERLPVTLTYSQSDRHAITVAFHPGTDSEVRWTFARDLLVNGLHHSVGIGDVIVWPAAPDRTAENSTVQRVHIRLRSPEGTALLSVARPDITAFLDISEALASSAVTETDNGYLKAWERELTELICPRASE